MNKEQFIQFKKDLKNDIEITRIYNSDSKQWWNQGFKSEEDYKKSWEEKESKIKELKSQLTKGEKGYQLIYATSYNTHWAYYCAKHQLDENQRKEYITEMFGKLKECKQNEWSASINNSIKKVEEILESYEKVVCSN